MKYPCNIIRDLLPLYLDNVCSNEAKEIVKEHLENCPECSAYFHSMVDADKEISVSISSNTKNEFQKASSFRAVKKKILYKQILAAIISIFVLIVITFSIIGILKKSTRIVPYENNISVSMVDGNLIGRLYGSEYSHLKIKTLSINQDGQDLRCAFYFVSDTIWNDITTSENVFSEYVICQKDKNADAVDRVYYYTGNYTDLESMSDAELEDIIQSSKLLWEKDKEK